MWRSLILNTEGSCVIVRYRYTCDVKPKDLWYLYLYRMYHSVAGMVTLILGISLIALTIAFWNRNGIFLRTVLILASLLVPVVQPLGMYLRSVKELEQLPKDMELCFGDAGIYVKVGEKSDHVSWQKVRHIAKEINMIMLVLRDGRGYMVTDRVMGQEKDDFYRYVFSRISK